MQNLNLLRDGYEAVADAVSRHIKAGRVDYSVHVKPTGSVMVARMSTRQRTDRPPSWFVGNYQFAGLRTEHIEDDLLLRERELRALEVVVAIPRRHQNNTRIAA